MKLYELTYTNGQTAGLFRTKAQRDAAYIDNFLNGGPEFIETETEIEPDKNGFICLWAGYCFLHTPKTDPESPFVKWSERRDKVLTPYFRTPEEAHEVLKKHLPKGCKQASSLPPYWYTDNTPERLADYCTQMHHFRNGE